MSSIRIYAGLATLMVAILAGQALFAEENELRGMAPFEPTDTRPYDDWAAPNQGFFFSFDGLVWNIKKPRNTSVGDPTLTPSVSTPTGDSFIEHNTIDTGFINENWKLGDRMEGGYIEGHNGFKITTMETNNQTTLYNANNAFVVFNEPQVAFNGTGGLLDIVYARDPVTGALTLAEAPVNFTSVSIVAKSRTTGAEAQYIYRTNQLPDGATVEFGLGGRYFELKDQFYVAAVGGNLADSFWNTTSKNLIGGPELSMLYYKPVGRAALTVEGRFTAGVNSEVVRQDGLMGSTLLAANPFPFPTLMSATGFTHDAHFTDFSPIVELRAEASYQITNLIRAKVGWTGMWINNVVRAADVINYTVPDLGILTGNHDTRQDVFMNGLTIGVELNR